MVLRFWQFSPVHYGAAFLAIQSCALWCCVFGHSVLCIMVLRFWQFSPVHYGAAFLAIQSCALWCYVFGNSVLCIMVRRFLPFLYIIVLRVYTVGRRLFNAKRLLEKIRFLSSCLLYGGVYGQRSNVLRAIPRLCGGRRGRTASVCSIVTFITSKALFTAGMSIRVLPVTTCNNVPAWICKHIPLRRLN